MHVSGMLAAENFHTQYSFLSDLHASELVALCDDYKHACKLLANSLHDLHTVHEEEVRQLERAVKRVESVVHWDMRDKVEAEALQKAVQTEREWRKQSKRPWFMKQCALLAYV